MDKIKYIKIEDENGNLSDNIPIGADASNIDTADGNNIEDGINIMKQQINLLEQEDDLLQSKINKLSSGSPIAAESIEDMTDQNRIYVNISDGKWYYYDEGWKAGGVYQAIQVGDKSININNLTDSLLNSLNLSIPEFTFRDGFYNIYAVFDSNANFQNTTPIKLLKNQTIKATVRAYNTMSVFTKCDENGNNRQVEVVGIQNIFLDYEYTAIEDCYIIVSGAKDTFTVYIKDIDDIIIKNINDIEENINDIEENINDIINILNGKKVPLLSIFETIGIIGDSHTAGAIEGTGTKDCKNLSTMAQVCKQCGNTPKFYARSGESVKSWLDYNYSIEECKAYVIALGSNDRTAQYPCGSSSDISNNTPSFYYYYNQIINKIKTVAPKAKIFLFSLYGNDTDPASIPYNDAIKYFADNTENCFFVDMRNSYTIYQDYKIGGHMSAIGYTFIADYVINQTNDLIISNYDKFNNVGIY